LKRLSEAKRAQDAYLERIQADVERDEQSIREFKEQVIKDN